MHRNVTSRLLFVVLLFLVLWSALRVIAPFLAGLTWAAVLVVTFRPFHRRLVVSFRGRTWAATAVVTLLVAAFVLVPVAIAAVQAVEGAVAAYESARQLLQAGTFGQGLGNRAPWLKELADRGMQLVGLANVDLRAVAIAGLQRVAQFLAVQGPALVGGALGLAFSFLVIIIGLPVLFTHGEALSEAVAETLPFPAVDGRRILRDIGDMTRSVFTSVGLTSATQAALIGLALLVLGVPSPAPLAALTFFLALVAGRHRARLGARLALWLAAQGHTWSAAAMALWGGGVVGTIDNILRPLLAGRGVKLEGTTLFFGMVGGMIAFGLVGLFLGPIALYAARELITILRRDVYAETGRDTVSTKPVVGAWRQRRRRACPHDRRVTDSEYADRRGPVTPANNSRPRACTAPRSSARKRRGGHRHTADGTRGYRRREPRLAERLANEPVRVEGHLPVVLVPAVRPHAEQRSRRRELQHVYVGGRRRQHVRNLRQPLLQQSDRGVMVDRGVDGGGQVDATVGVRGEILDRVGEDLVVADNRADVVRGVEERYRGGRSRPRYPSHHRR